MADRSNDWLAQGRRDLRHAVHSMEAGYYEWSCFSAQQAAEKAVKAVFLRRHAEAWGHSVTQLLGRLPEEINVSEELFNSAKKLDKHYIPSRYPNGFESGIPADYYTADEAQEAINNAERIIKFCEGILRG